MRLKALECAVFSSLLLAACSGDSRSGDELDSGMVEPDAALAAPDASAGEVDAELPDLGCKSHAECGPNVCDPETRECVQCVGDSDCALGNVCSEHACVPGCNAEQACAGQESCCEGTCIDTQSDELNCGQCGEACEVRPHVLTSCESSACAYICEEGFADCNGEAADGCEHNVTELGDCACEPLATRSCYDGAGGTLGVGACKGGISTCDASGLFWGPCEGQVLPAPEQCANQVDEDCNGTPDDVPDVDGDGFTVCEGDCCETTEQCPEPAKVNPAAHDFPGDELDDDCSGSAASVMATCSSAQKFADVTALNAAQAMDICQTTTAQGVSPGLLSASFVQPDGSAPSQAMSTSLQNWQTAVMTAYGVSEPRFGDTLFGLSNGRMRGSSDAGFVSPDTSLGHEHATTSGPIAAYLAVHGGGLPALSLCGGGCPTGTGIKDAAVLKLQLKVPSNAQGFSFDFRFFSYEYWQYQCTQYNDHFLVLLDSNAAGLPSDKNIASAANGSSITVTSNLITSCAAKGCMTCPHGTGDLYGTGMSTLGGATAWKRVSAPVVPGETITLHFMIFDVGDQTMDSHVLLDRFTWLKDSVTFQDLTP